jgi:site-specific recombinase XerD
MSTIHARIKRYKNSETAKVSFRIKDGKSIDISYTSNIVVETNKWDDKTEGYPRKVILTDYNKESVNQEVFQTLCFIQQLYESNKYLTDKPTTYWLKRLVDEQLLLQRKESVSANNHLIEDFRLYIETYVQNKNRQYHFNTVMNSLKRFIVYLSVLKDKDQSLSYKTINYEILTLFKLFLQNEHAICKKYLIVSEKPISKSRKNTTVNGYLKKLRTFLYHYKKINHESYNPFESFRIDSDKFGIPLHLTNNEFEYLQKVAFPSKRLQIIRDLFVLNALLGFRVSDFFNLKHTDIINGRIEYFPSKTSKYEIQVKVPLLDQAKDIIRKYKCESEYIVPKVSLKTYNMGLKELFRYIGFDRIVTFLDSETGQTAHAPLYERITSHCARRTFIAGLVAAGVSDRIICSMTGHQPHSREISRYYTISEETQKNALKHLCVESNLSELINSNTNLFHLLKAIA